MAQNSLHGRYRLAIFGRLHGTRFPTRPLYHRANAILDTNNIEYFTWRVSKSPRTPPLRKTVTIPACTALHCARGLNCQRVRQSDYQLLFPNGDKKPLMSMDPVQDFIGNGAGE